MASYPLGEVLTSVLTALSAAQRESDKFSQSLYVGVDDPKTDILPVPWAQLSTASLALKFAIDSVEEPQSGGPQAKPELMVFVSTADLEPLPAKDISTLEIQISVSDQEYVTTESDPDATKNRQ